MDYFHAEDVSSKTFPNSVNSDKRVKGHRSRPLQRGKKGYDESGTSVFECIAKVIEILQKEETGFMQLRNYI